MTLLERHTEISSLAFKLFISGKIGATAVLETDVASPPTYRARAVDNSWVTPTLEGPEMLALLQERDQNPTGAEQSLLKDKKDRLEGQLAHIQGRIDAINGKITP